MKKKGLSAVALFAAAMLLSGCIFTNWHGHGHGNKGNAYGHDKAKRGGGGGGRR